MGKAAPEVLEARTPNAKEFYNNIVQLDYELNLLKQVPEMREQRKKLEATRYEQTKMLRATNAGFDPYFYNRSSWYHGFLVKPGGRHGFKLYKRALPPHVIEAYNRAKMLDIFDQFTVISPDASLFEDYPSPRPVDPILLGHIGYSGWSSDGRWYESDLGQMFLIAQWDIGKDLQAAGLLELPAPEPKVDPSLGGQLINPHSSYR